MDGLKNEECIKLECYRGPQSGSGCKSDDCGTAVAGFKVLDFSGRVFLSRPFANKGETLPLKNCSTQLEPRVGESTGDVESSN